MTDQIIYDFALDRWTPTTLPMARLCQYLEKLSLLFGSKENVHFTMVRKGSAIPQISVDQSANENVYGRVKLLGKPDAPKDIQNLQREINRMLQADNCVGTLRLKGGATIYKFPGRKTPLTEEVVIHEFGELDGELIRVGGKDDSVPVWIQAIDGSVYKCTAKKSAARELAPLIFSEPIRVSGNGKWRRSADRVWVLEEFEIKSWLLINADDLQVTVDALRAVDGSGWNEMNDPQGELRKLRSDE
jgi:hypothetical protein